MNDNELIFIWSERGYGMSGYMNNLMYKKYIEGVVK